MPRIFIGVKMSEKIERLAAGWSSDKQGWPARWVKSENLHLTLVPPFYEDKIEMIVVKLARIKTFRTPAILRFRAISYGPRPGDYRLVWAIGQPSPELEKLKAEIDERLNLKIEKRNFLPHLTLARFRREDYNKFRVKNLSERINWEEEVKSFSMFESILRPEGAEYKVIKSF